jgi:hypothetical protein
MDFTFTASLRIQDRLVLELLLPHQAQLHEARLAHSIRQKIRFDDQQKDELGLVFDEGLGSWVWDDEWDTLEVEIGFEPDELAYIQQRLDFIDIGAGVESSMLPLFDVFMSREAVGVTTRQGNGALE